MEEYFYQRNMKLLTSSVLSAFDMCDDEMVKENSIDREEYSQISQKIWNKRNPRSEEEIEAQYLEFNEEFCENLPEEATVTKGIPCNAGRNTCHITWDGYMTPCVTIDAIKIDVKKYGFEESYKKLVEESDEIPRLVECITCPHSHRCLTCIAAHYSDTGEFGKVSERLCWKKQHPEEAEELEKHLISKGLLKKKI